MKIKVTYTAQFVAEIDIDDMDDVEAISDAISDIDIPENEQNKYKEDSFDVEFVEDESGKEVEY